MDLTKELKHLTKTDDVNALRGMLTKRGRPQRGTRAITEEDKSRCLDLAIPQGSLKTIELLIRHGARLAYCSFFAAMRREKPKLLKLFIKWGWDMDSTLFGQSAVQLVGPSNLGDVLQILSNINIEQHSLIQRS
jgi:hypothetical protein